MTIQPLVPTSLPWVYDLIVGQEWPQGDEDALRRCAQAWTEALGALVGIADGGNTAASVVGYSVQAVSSDQFDKYWSRYTKGEDSVVGQMAQQCQGLAGLLLQDAEQVEFTKLSINIQVVILAIQLTVDIATAIVTAGSSMAEGAAAATAARFTVKKLLTELLKGALMAAAPDFITQTIMLAEGHRSSYDINETLQAAGQGALGAGIGMGVGGVTGKLASSLTGKLASSLTGSLGEDAAKGLGGKLLTGAINTGNAAITGALTNMVTTGATDVATGQSLDNVWSAGANGAANGLLFHGAHALGEGIGSAMRPKPTHFSLADGGELHGLRLKDGSFSLFDEKGMKHGTGTFDPQSGQLSVQPVNGEPYRVPASTGDQAHPDAGYGGGAGGDAGTQGTPERESRQSVDPGARGEPSQGPESGSRGEPNQGPEPVRNEPVPPRGEPVPTSQDPQAPRGEPASPGPPRQEPMPSPEPPHRDPAPPHQDPAGGRAPEPEPPGRVWTPEPPRDVPGPTPEPQPGGSGPTSEPRRHHGQGASGPDPAPVPGEPDRPVPDLLPNGGASLASADPEHSPAVFRPDVSVATSDPVSAPSGRPGSEADRAADADLGLTVAATSAAAAAMDGGRVSEPSQRSASSRRAARSAQTSATRPTGNSMLDAIRAAAEPVVAEPRTAVIPEPEVKPEPVPTPAAGRQGQFASLGPEPTLRSGYVPIEDPTPQVGKWTEKDEGWQRIANNPQRLGGGKSLEEIHTSWHNGEEPPRKVTREDMRAAESDFIRDHPDAGRRAFYEQVRDELDRRHDVVKGDLERIRDDLGIGKFKGEDHYRKLAESMDRKLDAIPGLSFQEFLSGGGQHWAGHELNEMALDVNDPLRYTLVFDGDVYARGAHDTLRALHAAGYQLLDEVKLPDGTKVPGHRPLLVDDRLPEDAKFAKNFWRDGNRYLGMNITLVDPHGGPFELQFHTPESFDVKQQLSHAPYEVYRRPELPVESRVNSMLELVGMSDHYLSGHVPDGLEDFAPRSKDAGLDKLFGDVRGDVQKQIDHARTPQERARAEQQMAELEQRRRSLIEANREELAAHLRRLGRDDLSPEEVGRLFGETVELVKAGEQLKLDPAEVRRQHFTAPSYEPPVQEGAPVSEPTPAHEGAPARHGESNDHVTGLGPSPHDPSGLAAAGHYPVTHLDDPIRISQDHLAFQMRDEHGDLAFAHLQRINDRWVLHSGGPQGEELQALGANLRTTPPGLDLIGHATPEGFLIGGKTVPFEDVMAHIPGASEDTSPIRLIACEAGGAHGEAAQRLADLSGRNVIAADSTVWLSPDGHALVSNPVDRATNWYPKIPPDGVWHEFEPGGAPRRLADNDPRLPLASKEVRSAAGQKLAALGNDRNVLPAKAGDSSAAYAKNPVEEPVNPDEKLPPETNRELDHSVLGNALENEQEYKQMKVHAIRDFEEAVSQKLAEAANHFKLRDLAEAYQNHPGVDEDSARPLRPRILDEVQALTKDGLSELVKGRTPEKGGRIKSFVKIGDITVQQSVPFNNPQPSSVRIEGFPLRHHSYEEIAKDLGEFSIRLKAAGIPNPDVRIAGALKRLLSEEPLTPEKRAEDLRKLAITAAAQEFDAGKNGEAPLTADQFVQMGGSLAHLVGHLEPARDPRALLNLANLDIAAHGGMTVVDAVWFFNPVSQVGGARQARQAHTLISSDIGRGDSATYEPAPAHTIPELLRSWKDGASLRASNPASYFHDIEGADEYWPAKQKTAKGMKPPTFDQQKAKFIAKLEAARAQEQGPDKGQVDAFARKFFTLAEGAGWEHSLPPVVLPDGLEWDRIPPRGSYTRTEVASRFDPIVLDESFEAIPHMPMDEFKELLKATKQNLDVDTRTREALVESFIERRKHSGIVTRESVIEALSEPSRPWEVTSFAPQDPVETMKKMTKAQFQDLLRRAEVGAAVQQDAEVGLRMRNALARYLEQEYLSYTGEREERLNPEVLPPMADLLARVFASYQNVPSSLATADTPITTPGTPDAP